MLMSDWSSDECSSDLPIPARPCRQTGRSDRTCRPTRRIRACWRPAAPDKRGSWRCSAFPQLAGDDHLAHFGCAGADLQQLDRAVQAVDFRLPHVAAAAVDLHGLVPPLVPRLGAVPYAACGLLVERLEEGGRGKRVVVLCGFWG